MCTFNICTALMIHDYSELPYKGGLCAIIWIVYDNCITLKRGGPGAHSTSEFLIRRLNIQCPG